MKIRYYEKDYCGSHHEFIADDDVADVVKCLTGRVTISERVRELISKLFAFDGVVVEWIRVPHEL